MQTKKNPGAANTGADQNERQTQFDTSDFTVSHQQWQSSLSTCHLSRSLKMSLSSAAAVALANGWGDVE